MLYSNSFCLVLWFSWFSNFCSFKDLLAGYTYEAVNLDTNVLSDICQDKRCPWRWSWKRWSTMLAHYYLHPHTSLLSLNHATSARAIGVAATAGASFPRAVWLCVDEFRTYANIPCLDIINNAFAAENSPRKGRTTTSATRGTRKAGSAFERTNRALGRKRPA